MTEPSRPARRERERLRHRQEILDAARKLVVERGLGGVTVEDVARASEFAVGSIYRHFRSKDELIEELVVDLAQGYFEDLAALAAEGLPFHEHLLRAVAVSGERHAESLPLMLAIYVAPGPMPLPGTPQGDRLRELGLRMFSAFDSLLARGQAAGLLRPGNRAPMVIALTSIVRGFTKAPLLTGTPIEGDFATAVVSAFLDGARAPGAPA